MRVIKTPSQLYSQFLALYRIKDEQQRRDRLVACAVVLIGLALLYYFFT